MAMLCKVIFACIRNEIFEGKNPEKHVINNNLFSTICIKTKTAEKT